MAEDSRPAADGRSYVPAGSTVVLVVSRGPAPTSAATVAVPASVGSSQSEALASIQQAGLNAQVFTAPSDAARGEIVAQWPHANESVEYGSSMALLTSSGPAVEGTVLTGVPNVIGLSEAEAHSKLEQVGLRGHSIGEYSSTVPAGVVFGQLPEERAAAAPPKKSSPWLWVALAAVAVVIIVALVIAFSGSGGETIKVPNVVGMTQAEAEQTLEEKDLKAGEVTEESVADTAPGTVLTQDPTVGTEVDPGTAVNLTVSANVSLATVPDVVGRTQSTAEQIIEDAELVPSATQAPSDKVDKGAVVSQTPKAGQLVPIGTVVGIVVSTGPEQKNVSVPDVVGTTSSAAQQQLSDAGLKSQVVENYSDTVPEGEVISQAPPAGASVAQGTQIAIVVSKGPQPSEGESAQVPNVVGRSLTEATSILKDVGFTVTSLTADGSGKPADQVLYQAPGAGETAPLGSEVALVISSGK